MTNGPYGPWPVPQTIDEAYKALRANCGRLEELLETCPAGDKFAKRADKAVTVMKVGFKILKKAKKQRRDETRLSLVKS